MERNISSVSGIDDCSKDDALRNSGQQSMNGEQRGIVGDLKKSVG
jgi:hypothetical protein